MKLRSPLAAALSIVALSASCADDVSESPGPSVDSGIHADVETRQDDVAGDVQPGADATDLDGEAWRCEYANPFGGTPECKDYDGEAWTLEAAEADCSGLPSQGPTAFASGTPCAFDAELGRCAIEDAAGAGYTLVIGGADPSLCAISETACEALGGGVFAPGETCVDGPPVEPPPISSAGFVQPYLDCREPLEGEPLGQSGGEVCTQVLISACTEESRQFADYASCDDVRTQRPYFGYTVPLEENSEDPRLADEEYREELEWVTDQVEACACVCCHSSELAPTGASGWHIEAGTLWIDSVPDQGLAMLAGLVDSAAFGAYPPEQNNGFDRTTTGLPTTDPTRMRMFLLNEYLSRGYEEEDAASYAPFGGPLHSQSLYEPEACGSGVGFDENGRIEWRSGAARYLYVLAANAENPGVPPNRDLPDGTLWRVDVANDGVPIQSGVEYGVVPESLGVFQRFPFEEEPQALVAGEAYYIYALADVGVPIVRCLSVWPGTVDD